MAKRKFVAIDDHDIVFIHFSKNKFDSNFIDVNETSPILFLRNKVVGSFYTRPHYNEINKRILNILKVGNKKLFAIIGTAGIGKSTFFLSLLNDYLSNPKLYGNTVDAGSFYYQLEPDSLIFFEFVSKNISCQY